MKNKRIVIYMNDALRSDLKAAAAEQDTSLGELCRRLLRVGLFADKQREK